MIYTSRPEAGDPCLVWDQFTILHEAEPLEMEPLNGGSAPDMWRFRYLDSSGRPTEVQLKGSGLEAGPADPGKLLRIKEARERAMRERETALAGPTGLVYFQFGVATVAAVTAVITGVLVPRRWSSSVRMALALMAMGWLALAVQHLADWWRRRTGRPRRGWDGLADSVFLVLAFGMVQLLAALAGTR